MSTIFSSVYKNYYERLKVYNENSVSSNAMQEKVENLDSSTKKLANLIGLSSWKEKGKSELVTNVVPDISKKASTLGSNIINNLIKVSDMSKKELFPLLQELKDKDEEYDKLQDQIRQNRENGIDYRSIESKANELYDDMKQLVTKIDNKIIEIRSQNNVKSYETNTTNIFSSSTTTKKNSLESLIGRLNKSKKTVKTGTVAVLKALINSKSKNKGKTASKMGGSGTSNIIMNLKNTHNSDATKKNRVDSRLSNNDNISHWTSLGESWVVVNTKMSPAQYESYAITKGIREDSNPEKYGDHCLAFSYVHASNLYNGYTGDNAESAYHWAHSSEFTDFFSESKQETLSAIYEQIISGKPVVLQVNGNSQGTVRHFVTVVGFKDSVKSAYDIEESDLLIMDSWDGKLERMDVNGSRFMTTGAETHKSYSGYYLRVLK